MNTKSFNSLLAVSVITTMGLTLNITPIQAQSKTPLLCGQNTLNIPMPKTVTIPTVKNTQVTVSDNNNKEAELYAIIGIGYYESKDYEKAVENFTKAINLNSDFAEAYFLRGGVYALLKEYEQARFDLEKAAQLFQEQNKPEEYQKAQELLAVIRLLASRE